MKLRDARNCGGRWLNIFVFTVAILFTVIYFLTPLYGDDLWFLIGTNKSPSRLETFMTLVERTSQRWHTETGRFVNMISPPFLGLIPKWIMDLLCGVFIYLLFRLSIRVSGVRRNDYIGILLVASITLFMPWYDSMFSRMFTINYVWTAVANLFFILLMFRSLRGEGKGTSETVLTVIYSFFVGWMHEGFSVPVLCGFAGIALWRRMRKLPLPPRSWAYILSYLFGAVIITLSPMFNQRASGSGTRLTDMPLWEVGLMTGPPVLILLAFIVVMICCRKHLGRNTDETQTLILAVIVSVVSLLVTAIFYGGPRACFFSDLMDFIAIAMILSKSSRQDRGNGVGRKIIFLCAVILPLVNLCYAIKVQSKLKKECDEIQKLFLESPTGIVFYDNYPMKPDISLLKTSVGQFNLRHLSEDFSYYHAWIPEDDVPAKLLRLLPSGLKDFEGVSSVPEGNSQSEPFVYNGQILVQGNRIDEQSPGMIILTDKESREVPSRYRAVFFEAPDSTHWALLTPHVTVYDDIEVQSARFAQ